MPVSKPASQTGHYSCRSAEFMAGRLLSPHFDRQPATASAVNCPARRKSRTCEQIRLGFLGLRNRGQQGKSRFPRGLIHRASEPPDKQNSSPECSGAGRSRRGFFSLFSLIANRRRRAARLGTAGPRTARPEPRKQRTAGSWTAGLRLTSHRLASFRLASLGTAGPDTAGQGTAGPRTAGPRSTRRRSTGLRGGSRFGRGSIGTIFLGHYPLICTPKGYTQHREKHRDATNTRAIHSKNLQLTGTVALRDSHSRRHSLPAPQP